MYCITLLTLFSIIIFLPIKIYQVPNGCSRILIIINGRIVHSQKECVCKLACYAFSLLLSCPDLMLKHIFDKYPVSSGGVLDQYMSYRPDKLSVLNYRAAAQGHVNTGVKDFSRFLEKIISICRKPYIFDHF